MKNPFTAMNVFCARQEAAMPPRLAPGISTLLAAAMLASAMGASAAGQTDPSQLRFAITGYDVAGNTLLTPAEVDAAVRPYTGSANTFADVQRALEALQAVYHARGWQMVTVQLPEQELDKGVVKLVVQQQRIGNVNVSGNKFSDAASVRRAMPTLVPGATPNMTDVSANLKLANENPARVITLKLQSAAANDVVDANLQVSDASPWKAMLNVDNNGSEPTGKTNVSAVLQHANLWGRDHLASIQYSTTAENPGKISVYGMGYHVPLYALGDSLDFYATYSNVDSGSVTAGLFDLAIVGKGTVLGARYNHILAKRGQLEQRLAYGIDSKTFESSVLFAGVDFGNEVTVRPLSLGWSASMPLADGSANLSLTLVHNMAGGSKGDSDAIAQARFGGKANFNLLRFASAYTLPIVGQWQMRWLLNGQLSGDALVPGEQFGVGGSATVRGLDERALSGDSGLYTNLELYSPDLGDGGMWQWRALAFADSGRISRNKALPGEDARASVASVGLGLRVRAGDGVNAQIDFGRVVHGTPSIGNDRNKLHVRLGLAY